MAVTKNIKPVKKAVVKKAVAKKAVAKKAVAKKAVAKKAVVKKAVAKNAVVKKAVAKKAVPKKAAVKKIAVKKAAVPVKSPKPVITKKVTKPAANADAINNVKVRMYCLGTGDCFILKFCNGETVVFTMMIDCGSCQGGPAEFEPYIKHLADYVNSSIDLLVVTHEHNDHVNGFSKCENIFKDFKIGEAWFAWTENPEDPTGAAGELLKKRSQMKLALNNAINAMSANSVALQESGNDDFYAKSSLKNNQAFLKGMQTLADINLPVADGEEEAGNAGNSLPGMAKIKKILQDKKTVVQYLSPGQTVTAAKANGVKFHVLGPPMDRDHMFKDGKEGTDVYKKKLSLNESSLAAAAFLNMNKETITDLPFGLQFTIKDKDETDSNAINVQEKYKKDDAAWRKIDNDWLNSAGSLALRLNSHINNTSLALAIEFYGKKVLLFPGDAEYGSWESWHEIEKWKSKEPNGKHFAEDLLNRTIFYKVGHHLSYNGTALQKGIMMMESEEFAAMATLDRKRISLGWKSTMPNTLLLQEIIKRSKGKFFIMNEAEIDDGPSKTLNPLSLKNKAYTTEAKPDGSGPYYIQYTCAVD